MQAAQGTMLESLRSVETFLEPTPTSLAMWSRQASLAKIARIAAADLPNVPELESLRMPRGKLTVEKLAAAASRMAKTAALYADVFISAGLP